MPPGPARAYDERLRVTDPKLAALRERILAAKPSFLRLVDGTEDAAFLVADGVCVVSNEAAARLFAAPDGLVGKTFADFAPPESLPAGEEALARTQKDLVRAVLRMRRADGTPVDVEVITVPFDVDGQVVVLTIARDVSVQVAAEEAGRRTRDLVQSVVDVAPALVFAKDLSFRYVMVNRSFAAMLGQPQASLIGRADSDFWPDGVVEGDPQLGLRGYHETDRRAFAGETVRQPAQEISWPGEPSPRYYDSVKHPLRDPDGRIVGVLVHAHDVTERVLAEQRLAESESRLRAFFDQAAVGVGQIDPETRAFSRVNARFCEILGRDESEILGLDPAELTHPDDLEADARDVRALTDGKVREFSREKRYLRADGSPVWAAVSVTALRNPDGTTWALLAIVQDVSARRAAEEALRRSEDRLRQSEQLDAIGRLAGGVAHDFNNLLTVILGLTSELEPKLEGRGDALELLREVHDAGVRAGELTRQLLAFARRQLATPRNVDLNERIRTFERFLHRVIGEDVKLVLELEDPLPSIRLDPSHLEQILLNLAANARDAMPDGGSLHIGTSVSQRVDDGSVLPGVELYVRDTGVGMSATTRARVFEPFFTTKALGRGTGLGLATVYGIVKQSRGDIAVESEEPGGTTFRVFFPRATDTLRDSGERPAVRAGSGETILVVEDDAPVRAVTVRLLTTHGYRILQAPGPREALAMAQAEPRIDLLVTDVVMPDAGGVPLARELLRQRPGLPVLFVTGYAREGEAIAELGRLLHKPFTPDALLGAVRELLDGARVD